MRLEEMLSKQSSFKQSSSQVNQKPFLPRPRDQVCKGLEFVL